jgi:hypothetical protein
MEAEDWLKIVEKKSLIAHCSKSLKTKLRQPSPRSSMLKPTCRIHHCVILFRPTSHFIINYTLSLFLIEILFCLTMMNHCMCELNILGTHTNDLIIIF